MNASPLPAVSEEDVTEAAPFFNIIEEDDAENDIDTDYTELFFCHNVADFPWYCFLCLFFFIKDTVILHPRITHLLSCFCHFSWYEINVPFERMPPPSSPKNFINAPGVYSKHYGKTYLCGL